MDSSDRPSPVGTRDHAILLLFARLGIRAGDILQLRLDDIHWMGAWVRVRGKGRRDRRLPLTDEVGQGTVSRVPFALGRLGDRRPPSAVRS